VLFFDRTINTGVIKLLRASNGASLLCDHALSGMVTRDPLFSSLFVHGSGKLILITVEAA
jgi:hypothetical protein